MGPKLDPLFLFPEELDINQRSSSRPSHHLEEDFGGLGSTLQRPSLG